MDKGSWIWMDGEFVPWDEANVHVLTHTLHYGFGVFEGIRCYRQEDGSTAIFRLEEHNRRLFDSAHILGLPIPFSRDEIYQACLDTVERNGLEEGYLRPLVFNGAGEIGLAVLNQVRVRGLLALGRLSRRRCGQKGDSGQDLLVLARAQ